MLRPTFFLAALFSIINVYYAYSPLVQIFSFLSFVVCLGIAIVWPEPLPPPPPPDLWSDAPETKEREMKTCSSCGKAVDQKWSMCPYCSKRV